MSVLIDRREWDRQCTIVIKELIPDAEPNYECTPLMSIVHCYVLVPDGRVLTLQRQANLTDMDWKADTRIFFEALAESFLSSANQEFKKQGWRYRDAIWL